MWADAGGGAGREAAAVCAGEVRVPGVCASVGSAFGSSRTCLCGLGVRLLCEQKASDKVKQLNAALEEKERAVEQLERAVEAAAGRAGAGEEWKAGMAGEVEATRAALRAGSEALGAECDVLVELVAAVQSQVLY